MRTLTGKPESFKEGLREIALYRKEVVDEIVGRITRVEHGLVTIYSGMKGGKSTTIQGVLDKLKKTNIPAELAKPAFIGPSGEIISGDPFMYVRNPRGGRDAIRAHLLTDLDDFRSLLSRVRGGAVLIDEAMFLQSNLNPNFPYREISDFILQTNWSEMNTTVVMAGLDRYHTGEEWKSMQSYIDASDNSYLLNALCEAVGPDGVRCGRFASMTQRGVRNSNGEWVPFLDGPAIAVSRGAERSQGLVVDYFAVCESCHVNP